jgi:DNA-binding GntR family transcriptional regulator
MSKETVAIAFSQLKRRGLVIVKRGAGAFVVCPLKNISPVWHAHFLGKMVEMASRKGKII